MALWRSGSMALQRIDSYSALALWLSSALALWPYSALALRLYGSPSLLKLLRNYVAQGMPDLHSSILSMFTRSFEYWILW